MSESKTPRTDAAQLPEGEYRGQLVWSDFARTLERENKELEARIDDIHMAMDSLNAKLDASERANAEMRDALGYAEAVIDDDSDPLATDTKMTLASIRKALSSTSSQGYVKREVLEELVNLIDDTGCVWRTSGMIDKIRAELDRTKPKEGE